MPGLHKALHNACLLFLVVKIFLRCYGIIVGNKLLIRFKLYSSAVLG